MKAVSKEVKHEWKTIPGTKGTSHQCTCCRQWTANLPLYKDEVCPKKNRRKGGERRGRNK